MKIKSNALKTVHFKSLYARCHKLYSFKYLGLILIREVLIKVILILKTSNEVYLDL